MTGGTASATAYPFELREVRGPRAFGGGVRRFLALLWLTARTEFKAQHEHAILGSLWAILRPLGIALVLYALFTSVLRFGGDIEHYQALLLFNVMLFFFFADATSRGMKSMVRAERIVRKTEFPRAVIPLAVVLNQLFTLALSMIVVGGFFVALEVPFRWTWLLVPVLVLLLVVLTISLSMLLAALYPRFRDLDDLWMVIRRVIFYGSAVLFPIEYVPDNFQEIVLISPLAPILVQARQWIFDPDAPSIAEVAGTDWALAGPIAVFAGICIIGVLVFVRRAPRVAEEL